MADFPKTKTLNPLGWGYVEDALSAPEVARARDLMGGFFPMEHATLRAVPRVDAVALPALRCAVPTAIADICTTSHAERLLHCAGRSYRDIVALRSNQIKNAPDMVAYPRTRADVARVLEAAGQHQLAVIPFGGGSSVTGGVNPEVPAGYAGVLTLDLARLDRVLEVDAIDRVVYAEGGIFGPDLDAALRPHGLTVRHYPQSYYHSTLGGWVATRGAGHYSTLLNKIEDRVQSVDLVSPSGLDYVVRPLPSSSIAIDPNRLAAGSEGMLGVITSVRLRVQAVPRYRADASATFETFAQVLDAARAIVQAGLWPAQLRALDPFEAMVSALTSGGRPPQGALLIVGFESQEPETLESAKAAARLIQAHGGRLSPWKYTDTTQDKAAADEAVGAWRNTFFRQPYLRDTLSDWGVIADTFETAIPWSRVHGFYEAVRGGTLAALEQVCGGGGVLCRMTHCYPDGVALYFSFYGLGRHGELLDQWWQVRELAAQVVLKQGGTLSHHHSMGRDHGRWAQAELPAGYRAAVAGAKRALDPQGMMNPGMWWGDGPR